MSPELRALLRSHPIALPCRERPPIRLADAGPELRDLIAAGLRRFDHNPPAVLAEPVYPILETAVPVPRSFPLRDSMRKAWINDRIPFHKGNPGR